jgi:hypothetical protein
VLLGLATLFNGLGFFYLLIALDFGWAYVASRRRLRTAP